MDRDQLKRYPHGGGTVEAETLPWDHTDGDLLVSDNYVYVAMPGCPAVTRLAKRTQSQDSVYATVERPAPTTLLLNGDTVLCASGPQLYRVEDWGREMVSVASVRGRIFAAQIHGDAVYWFEEPPEAFAGTPYLWRLNLGETSAEPEQLKEAPTWIYEFVPGAPGVWALQTQGGGLQHLMAYLPETDTAGVLAGKVGFGGGISADERHYYFSQRATCCVNEEIASCRGTCCDLCSAIVRIPISTSVMPFVAP